LKIRDESGTANARGYLLALPLAMLLALAAAVPVFAAEEPVAEEPAAEDGGTLQPQVVGGDPVPNSKYEFVAALVNPTRRGSDAPKPFCGGTLIDEDSVLTAAHCVEDRVPSRVDIIVGRTALGSDQGEKRDVTLMVSHPRYSTRDGRDFDAAVLQLSSPVTGIEPVRLPATTQNAFEKAGRNLTIAGYGNTRQQSPGGPEPNRYPNRMREAEVPVVSDRRAKRIYRGEYSRDLMVAAGREGKDTCDGDSGGPLFKRTDRGPFQVGITSFGAGCGTRGLPGVYTEVNSDQIRPFIVNTAGL
jgi:secreted trypsin-like serine protease